MLVHDERDHLGGAETLLREITSALKLQGCQVEWAHSNIPRAYAMFRPDFVVVMTVITKIGLGALEWLQWRGIPHCLVLVDYWAGCSQRNMAHLSKGIICEECTGDCPGGPVHPQIREVVNRSPVVALNPYQADINHRLGVRTDTWIPCGLDTEFWQPAATRPAEPLRVMASTAWSQQHYGNIWWKGEQYLRRLESDLGITIHSITGVPRPQVRDALQQGHIYIFPSTWPESWGYCLLEAMACGLACVAFDQAGARTMLDRVGLLVQPGDYDGLRNSVAHLLSSQSERECMGRLAAQRVREQYSLDARGAAYLRFIHEQLSGAAA